VDGNRTHQRPRDRPLNGFEGRCAESVNAAAAATCEHADPALTPLLTDFSQKWPKLDVETQRQVLTTCLDSTDADLKAVVEAWANLPQPVRKAIRDIVTSAIGAEGKGS